MNIATTDGLSGTMNIESMARGMPTAGIILIIVGIITPLIITDPVTIRGIIIEAVTITHAIVVIIMIGMTEAMMPINGSWVVFC